MRSYYRKQNILILIFCLLVMIFGVASGISLADYGHELDSYLGNVCQITGIIIIVVGTMGGGICCIVSGIGIYRDEEFGDF